MEAALLELLSSSPELILPMLADAPLLVVVYVVAVRPWARRTTRTLEVLSARMARVESALSLPPPPKGFGDDDDEGDLTPRLGVPLHRRGS